MEHTPTRENWKQAVANEHDVRTLSGSYIGTFRNTDYAALAVACVNACEGMEDPAKEIQALRDRVKELEGNNIIYQNSSFEKPKTKEELAEDWRESKTDDEWIALLKKHNHYGYDRGIILDELIEMWELENETARAK